MYLYSKKIINDVNESINKKSKLLLRYSYKHKNQLLIPTNRDM